MRRTILIFILTTTIALTESGLMCNVQWPACSLTVQNIVCSRDEKCLPTKGCQDLPMDPEFSKFILHEHNRLRQKVASGQETRGYTGVASNMHVLSYDEKLEYSAKCNVNRCKYEHDSCHGTMKFPTAGQNLYFSATSEDDLKNAVNVWFNEIDKITSNVIDKFPKGHKDISEFAQIIWATTTHIGCARAKSTTEEKYYLVCNYGPAGNRAGHSVYSRGSPCSKCGLFTKCNKLYPALCGDIDQSYLGDGRGGSGDSENIAAVTTSRSSMKLSLSNSGRGNSASLNAGLGNGGSFKLGLSGSGGKSSTGLSTGVNVGIGNGRNMKLGFGSNGGGKSAEISTGLDVGLGRGGSMKLGFGKSGGKENGKLSTGLNLGVGNSSGMKMGFGETGTGLSTGLSVGGKDSGEIGASIGGFNVNVGLGRDHNKHKNGKNNENEEVGASIAKMGLGKNNNRGLGKGRNIQNIVNGGENDDSGVDEAVITVKKTVGLGAVAPKYSSFSTTHRSYSKYSHQITTEPVTDIPVPLKNVGTLDTDLVDIITDTETTYKTTQGPTTQESKLLRTSGKNVGIFLTENNSIFQLESFTIPPRQNVTENLAPLLLEPLTIFTSDTSSTPILPNPSSKPKTAHIIPPLNSDPKSKLHLKVITYPPKPPMMSEIVITPDLESITLQPIHKQKADSLSELSKSNTPVPKPMKFSLKPTRTSVTHKPRYRGQFERTTLSPKLPMMSKIVPSSNQKRITIQSARKPILSFEKITLSPKQPITPKSIPLLELNRLAIQPTRKHKVTLEKIVLPPKPPTISNIIPSLDPEEIHIQSIIDDKVNPIETIGQISPEIKHHTFSNQSLPNIVQQGIDSTNSFPKQIITYNKTEEETDSEAPLALGFMKWHEVKWYALGALLLIIIIIISFLLGRVCRSKGSYWIKKELPQPVHGKISNINQPTLYYNENDDNPQTVLS
ncbi:uncharacterized protein LOC130897249 [Diorhabda carinulata]|uniref:uncharacterized protein LOC130897249 n=1 Tax=Diorhabda carinulata TaxID=1163345 RepID=UPI0025A06190|nr:uncharacterized protein LOC130897249 [Diorhabda carinulata]